MNIMKMKHRSKLLGACPVLIWEQTLTEQLEEQLQAAAACHHKNRIQLPHPQAYQGAEKEQGGADLKIPCQKADCSVGKQSRQQDGEPSAEDRGHDRGTEGLQYPLHQSQTAVFFIKPGQDCHKQAGRQHNP